MYYIHFIWLGKNRIPREIINTWIPKVNDNYTIIVWRDFPDKNEKYDKDILSIGGLYNQSIFDESSKYNQKSDILRLEILYKYGGVYLDCDIIKTPNDKDIVETLESSCDKRRSLFITYEKQGCVSNSLIYVKHKKHKLIKFIINGLNGCKIKEDDGTYISVCQSTGPKYITKRLQEYKWNMENILPYHFVNFGIDYSKTFVNPEFTITENMKMVTKNKDLRYNPDFDKIMGIQLWMGGKKINYDNVTDDIVTTSLNNYNKYLEMIKQFYKYSDTNPV
jgi:hypothetical protein